MMVFDDYGIVCGNTEVYAIWAIGKQNREKIKDRGFNTMEELDGSIRHELKKIREENEE